MKPNLITSASGCFKSMAVLFALCAFSACQPAENGSQAAAQAIAEAAIAPDTVAKRPAPDFFVIPREMIKKRVWICEDGVADIFHVKHDCPVLTQCKGKGSFRNLLLPRAIEDFGRYNCQECSKDLDHIFDENAVRTL